MPTAEEVLAQQASEYQNAPRRPRWQPEVDGDYIEVVDEVQVGMMGDTAAVFVVGKIVDGQFENHKNTIGIYNSKNWSMLADLVEMLGGDPTVNSPLKAAEFLKSKIGTAINVRVAAGKKEGSRYANITGVVRS